MRLKRMMRRGGEKDEGEYKTIFTRYVSQLEVLQQGRARQGNGEGEREAGYGSRRE